MNPNLLHDLKSLQNLYARLLSLLIEERTALKGMDADALSQAVQAKQQLLSELYERSRGMEPGTLNRQVDAAPEPQREALRELMASLKHLAGEAQESNRVNGKIVARSQKSLRDLLAVLYGQQPESIYGEHGEARHLRAGGPVAQA